MKRLLVVAVLTILPGVILAQTPADAQPERLNTPTRLIPFRVTTPDSLFDFKTVSGGKLAIRVEFSHDVDASTVVSGSSLKVKMEKVNNAKGKVLWLLPHEKPALYAAARPSTGSHKRALVWTSLKPLSELCDFDPDCNFSLVITDKVKSTSGARLDGDKDGSPGGKFKQNFLLMG